MRSVVLPRLQRQWPKHTAGRWFVMDLPLVCLHLPARFGPGQAWILGHRYSHHQDPEGFWLAHRLLTEGRLASVEFRTRREALEALAVVLDSEH